MNNYATLRQILNLSDLKKLVRIENDENETIYYGFIKGITLTNSWLECVVKNIEVINDVPVIKLGEVYES